MRSHALFHVEHLVKTAVDFIFSEHMPELFFERHGHFPPAAVAKHFLLLPRAGRAPGLFSHGISRFSCDYPAAKRSGNTIAVKHRLVLSSRLAAAKKSGRQLALQRRLA